MSQPRSLKDRVEPANPEDRLLQALLPAPRDHRAGNADTAAALLAEYPEASVANIWVASACGEVQAVQELVAGEPGLASRRDGTRNWEPLLYLCFSRFLRCDPLRAERMVRAARVLLQHGADPNARWIDPLFDDAEETPIYGAAGVANNVPLARLLIEAGADPNDGETPYHMVEHAGVPCAEVIFPKLDASSRGTALVHLLDYDDLPGLRALLDLGDEQGRELLARGADPTLSNDENENAADVARARGHAAILKLLPREP